MKRLIVLISMISLIISGCSRVNTHPSANANSGFQMGLVKTGIGSTDSTFDKQKVTYDITIDNKDSIKIKHDLVNIVLSKWTKQNKLGSKITQKNFSAKNLEIKGYVVINTTGMTKEEIVNKQPFITGVNVVTNSGKKIFVKNVETSK